MPSLFWNDSSRLRVLPTLSEMGLIEPHREQAPPPRKTKFSIGPLPPSPPFTNGPSALKLDIISQNALGKHSFVDQGRFNGRSFEMGKKSQFSFACLHTKRYPEYNLLQRPCLS